ncbi:hypothetical protein WISP_116653 [Willisornis vidua]|uniref:Uncharacterized protein n=1 Tax=Willisornis vidua TaxID=1566151 RepID=A0ABQ9CTY7_9PASS|nr:hypothetical protein WISP_116653 [Willisornis vidua]
MRLQEENNNRETKMEMEEEMKENDQKGKANKERERKERKGKRLTFSSGNTCLMELEVCEMTMGHVMRQSSKVTRKVVPPQAACNAPTRALVEGAELIPSCLCFGSRTALRCCQAVIIADDFDNFDGFAKFDGFLCGARGD